MDKCCGIENMLLSLEEDSSGERGGEVQVILVEGL
jgi:hypothetical protein